MPIYQYGCPKCGMRFDVFKRLAAIDREELCPDCRIVGRREIVKTLSVRPMFEPYISEASGRVISTPSQRRDDLARTGCIEYDPEMRKDVQRREVDAEKQLDETLDRVLHEELNQLGA